MEQLGGGGFIHILFPQNAQIAGLEQLPEGNSLQVQILPGEGVDVPEPYALIISGLVDLNKGRQRPVQFLGKILPGGIAGAGQGDELAGEIHPPAAVCRGKLIVDGLRLILQREIPRGAGNFRGWNFLPGTELGEFVPDGLLKVHRGLGGNGQNFQGSGTGR